MPTYRVTNPRTGRSLEFYVAATICCHRMPRDRAILLAAQDGRLKRPREKVELVAEKVSD